MTTLEQIRERANQVYKDVGGTPLMAKVTPAQVKEARRWVDAVRRGRIFFYDTREVNIGMRNVDWSGSHIKHQEWPAQLNRFFWLARLVTVYRQTHEPDLPDLARRWIEDWMDGHEPYGAANRPAKGDNTLNISVRLGQADRGGWWNAAALLAGTPAFDEAFVRRMLESTHGQIECLVAHLAPTINWRISHLNCILFCSLVLPGFESYREFAVHRLNEAFWRQVDPDGSHVERCPSSYHQWMMRLFSNLVMLARARPGLGFNIDPARVGRMWDYALYSTTPDGGSSGLHDGAVWTPNRPMRDLALQRKRYLQRAELRGAEWKVDQRPDRLFPDAGQWFLRDSWKPDATQVSVDATRYEGGHNHLSRLAVNLYAGKRMLLYDPGIFTYENTVPFMAYGKATKAHNTITLHDYNQVETNPVVEESHLLKGFSLVSAAYAGSYFSGDYGWGFHQGPGRAEYGAHERVVLWVKGSYLLVFDLVKADHTRVVPYQAHWQFPIGKATLDRKHNAAWTGGAPDNVLVRLVQASGTVKSALHAGERKPILGWLPLGHGPEWKPAPHLVMAGEVKGGYASQVTLVVPFKGARPPAIAIQPVKQAAAGVHAFELKFRDGTTDVVMATANLHRMIGDSGPVSTDGSLAFVRVRKGRVVRAMLNRGTWLDYQGQSVIRRRRPETCEC